MKCSSLPVQLGFCGVLRRFSYILRLDIPMSEKRATMIFSEDAPTLEKELHRHFQLDSVNKVNPRKEFFGVSLPIIRQKVEQMGMKEVHWTMKADAAEYRESLAISREVEEVSA